MALVLVTPPAEEPVSLDEAKAHLRVDHDTDDDLITALIAAARQFAETFTRRAFVTQTWRLELDAFPAEIRLPRSPIQAVTSVQYVDEAGSTQTLGSSLYVLDKATEPARLIPAYDQSWPAARNFTAALKVTYTAGYGDAAAVPQAIKQALLLLIGHWYERREAVSVAAPPAEMPMAVDALLWQHRLYEF